MALASIAWHAFANATAPRDFNGDADIHVLRGQQSRPLTEILMQEDDTGTRQLLSVGALDPAVTITFDPIRVWDSCRSGPPTP